VCTVNRLAHQCPPVRATRHLGTASRTVLRAPMEEVRDRAPRLVLLSLRIRSHRCLVGIPDERLLLHRAGRAPDNAYDNFTTFGHFLIFTCIFIETFHLVALWYYDFSFNSTTALKRFFFPSFLVEDADAHICIQRDVRGFCISRFVSFWISILILSFFFRLSYHRHHLH
jgi:hypothetical protein